MTYMEITTKVKIPFSKGAKIVKSPDEDGTDCILIDGKYYSPDVILLKYDPENKLFKQIGIKTGAWSDCGEEIYELLDDRYVFQKNYELKILNENDGEIINFN